MSKKIQICMGSSCFARGNNQNLQLISKYLKDNNLEAEIELSGLRCCDLCSKGPNLTIEGVEYNNVDSGTLIDILDKVFKG
ncbi:MAG: (2Fe-2S) ferredoxin domain-containing protein [Alphaproteobacteria bacterium]|nr:(2Fe-2S) ferredoxin domain-containing protein [Alphaproteobacteria bacterium]